MEIKEFFEPVLNFIKGFQKKEKEPASKQAAKDRLKLVLMQDRASVSPDFFDMMKQEIIDVIKKYIEIDEESLEVELARGFEAGLEGPALYANIPIKNVKPVAPKSEESNSLSEEEADKLADEILDNIEAVASEKSTEENDEIITTSDEYTKDDSHEITEEASELYESNNTVSQDEETKDAAGDLSGSDESASANSTSEEIEVEAKKSTVKKKTSTSRKTSSKKSTTAKKTTSKKKKEE